MATLVDQRVSRRKHAREVKSLLKQAPALRKRGWLVESTSFPTVRVTFLASKVVPPVAILTVDLDFTNYNVMPPSIRLLNPVSLEPRFASALRINEHGQNQNLVITGHPDTGEPFVCFPGVREYHSHPEHSGDSWDLHRYTGEGTLYVLLENIWNYCVNTITGFAVPAIVMQQLQLCQEPRA